MYLSTKSGPLGRASRSVSSSQYQRIPCCPKFVTLFQQTTVFPIRNHEKTTNFPLFYPLWPDFCSFRATSRPQSLSVMSESCDI